MAVGCAPAVRAMQEGKLRTAAFCSAQVTGNDNNRGKGKGQGEKEREKGGAARETENPAQLDAR